MPERKRGYGGLMARALTTSNRKLGWVLDGPAIDLQEWAVDAGERSQVVDQGLYTKNALTILINLSTDHEILHFLVTDNAFIESLLSRITNPKEPTANLIAMLLANLAKSDDLVKRILSLNRSTALDAGLRSKGAMDQLMDCFVMGAEGRWNKDADFDYLAWVFADVAKHLEGRKYFVTKQAYDDVVPIAKLVVFTEHKSDVRRKGVASTIK
ncbi:hypothetical protein GP486_005582 [Trichoglossum hirsutum]|uniref:Protein HGH1 N-terminal domain-containing protein n=1 Tax=Trichoglossum hirsutum TaxID=265104 RepID=A0A9P8RMG0_9PEZI|nr:hypothetical protein GP486_005582 [Trichoglossum hirsutum]